MTGEEAYSERLRVTPDGELPPGAAGTPGNPLLLTDPRTMRALAHPARMVIWRHLGLGGPATATECAAVTGLSPSACSYHLRTLAKYGFVEEDPSHSADGRERPWRAKIVPTGTIYDVLHLTPEELDDLRRRLVDLFGEYRRPSRDERPAGARRVLVTADFVPWFPSGAAEPE